MAVVKMEDTLRKAVKDTGVSLWAVAKGAGLDYPVLYRFYHGQRSLRLESVQLLADYLGLALLQKPGKARKAGKP